MKPDNYVYFILNKAGNTSYSFTGYTDHAGNGELMTIYKGRKEKHQGEVVDIPHRWKFDTAHRTIRVHKNDKSVIPTLMFDPETGDEKKVYIKSVDFLRNHPECKNSPNSGGNWMFSEMKEHEDAVTAVDAKRVKIEAESKALNLEGAELKEMAVLLGNFDPDDAKQKHFVLERAGADPKTFLELLDSPERGAKALLLKAVSLGIVKVRGTLYSWEKEGLGADLDMAVAKLMKDKEIKDALRNAVKGIRK